MIENQANNLSIFPPRLETPDLGPTWLDHKHTNKKINLQVRDTGKGIEMNPENALENQLMVDRIS